ncbi:MAG: HD domain-containing phosphohydrolase [Myxococcota bacterium]
MKRTVAAVCRMVQQLAMAYRGPPKAPQTRYHLQRAAGVLQSLPLSKPLSIQMMDDRLIIDDAAVRPTAAILPILRDLFQWMQEQGSQGVVFSEVLDAAQLAGMFRTPELLPPGVRWIRSAEQEAALALEGEAMASNLEAIRATHRLHAGSFDTACIDLLRAAAVRLARLVVNNPPRALALTTVHAVAPYAFSHPVRRTLFAFAIGRRLGMASDALVELGMCGLSADLGLYQLPESLLHKKEMLSVSDHRTLHHHPLQTVQILMAAPALSPTVRRMLLVAYELRLGFDRGGYPVPLVWPELHPFSRLLAVCDAYDALVSDRPWRERLSTREALTWLRTQRNRRYDPLMVEEMEHLLKSHLPETLT